MKAIIKDFYGENVEVPVEASIYKDAHDANLTVPQYFNQKYPTDAATYGSAFEQVCASSGLLLSSNDDYGIRTPNLKAVLEGGASINAVAIVRDAVPASRILFPAVFLEYIENQLVKDTEVQPAMFEKMIAISDTIAGARFEQPVLSFLKPENARSQTIAQLATPPAMLRITASDVARKIPTFSIGLEISDEAAKVISIDLTALALARQVARERDVRVEGYINSFLTGDVDLGMSALTAISSTTLDSAATGGVLTQKAWIKFLAFRRRQRRITHVIGDIDTLLKVDGRTGRPTVYTANDPNYIINSIAGPVNLNIQNVEFFIVEAGVLPANTVLALDSNAAIRRVRNSEADYQAAEQFALRRGTGMRFDFGEIVYRLFDDAFEVLTIA